MIVLKDSVLEHHIHIVVKSAEITDKLFLVLHYYPDLGSNTLVDQLYDITCRLPRGSICGTSVAIKKETKLHGHPHAFSY